ncbi:DUF2975 domain-containing protein [Caulobacter sp.]|uniref:DUF2975 domain-containing protein n=1 Tax=Caulobacter sp. TaxID=78 RepID=UPI001AFEC06C|nr:DUF2975 domain-containing protein [Caulobacter sp.]MBO9547670.1 DUF2975 domain-containing protein [Caulobacter sp.]
MGTKDIEKFRRMCRQFRALAMFMVISVGLLLAFMVWVAPLLLMALHRPSLTPNQMLAFTIQYIPAACYLFGVWSIGQALGEVAKGRLLQAALPSALRRVGLALGIGGVANVFVVINLMRLVGADKRSYLDFDVAGMTLGMIGGALFLLGRVMDQALAAQAELDEMI